VPDPDNRSVVLQFPQMTRRVIRPRCTCGQSVKISLLETPKVQQLPRWVCPRCHCVNIAPVRGSVVSVEEI
jgi:hypothetical protein